MICNFFVFCQNRTSNILKKCDFILNLFFNFSNKKLIGNLIFYFRATLTIKKTFINMSKKKFIKKSDIYNSSKRINIFDLMKTICIVYNYNYNYFI